MARLDRTPKKIKPPSVKTERPRKVSVDTVYKLVVANLILMLLSQAVNYDKYVQLAKKLAEISTY
jgi:hypothetical protein